VTVSIDKERGEIIAERELNAPRAIVFKAFLDPQQIACFWGAAGMTTPAASVKVEAWAGGAFEALMISDEDGSEHLMRCTYIEIVEPELIVFKEHAMGLTSRMMFDELEGGRTRLSVRQTDVPQDILGPEVQAGFSSYLDKVAAYFAAR
jgi:uncharacterized protein YndB with AHSA1/START domain